MKSNSEIFCDVPLRLVTRRSQLALVQTAMVTDQLGDIAHEVIDLSTSGDEVLDRPLVEIGGKGVFIKALEEALISQQADAAVHSFKDMETVLAPQTKLGCVLAREDRRDALVGPYQDLDSLPKGAVIGTSSVRRASLLRHHRPDLEIKLLRGNVQRRLTKLAEGEFDAIILAMAGLKRLGIAEQGHPLDETVMMPAASQGVIAIQIATTDEARCQAMEKVFAKLHDQASFIATSAERALLAQLDGSCRTPIGAIADCREDGTLRLRACVLSTDGTKRYDAEAVGTMHDPVSLGQMVAQELLEKCGGRAFLA